MILNLVRHGQTRENAQRVYQGQRDVPLDETGAYQATRLGLRLREVCVDRVYTSDLRRAVDTARMIALAQHPMLEIWQDERLRECHLGDHEGRRIEEDSYRKDFEASGRSVADFCPRNGESWGNLQARAVECFHEIALLHPKGTVVIVSHCGTICALLLYLLRKEITRENQLRYLVANASVTTIHWNDATGALEQIEPFNDTSHL